MVALRKAVTHSVILKFKLQLYGSYYSIAVIAQAY